MIVVTRLNGPTFAVNPDLLQRIESTPDTILTLIDGTKYIVAESMEQVTALVVEYRARVVAATITLTGEGFGDTTVAAVTELRQPPVRTLTSVPEAD
jgi:flagellar protein FlbD